MLFMITTVISALVFAGVAYPSLAAAKAWPVGAWAHNENWSLFYGMGFVTSIWSALNYSGLLGAILVFVAGWATAFLLSLVLGRNLQTFGLAGPVLAAPWWVGSFFLS